MAERQNHGFAFEAEVIKTLNLKKDPNYTSTWDAWTEDGTPVSIKCISETGNIDCGSIVRMYQHFLRPGWIMYLGRHRNKVITSVHKYIFTQEICEKLAGKLTLEEVRDLDLCIKSFGRGEHEKAREVAQLWKKENKDRMGLLTVQPKIDSKIQRRVQCGINRTAVRECFGQEQSFDELKNLVGVNFGKAREERRE